MVNKRYSTSEVVSFFLQEKDSALLFLTFPKNTLLGTSVLMMITCNIGQKNSSFLRILYVCGCVIEHL